MKNRPHPLFTIYQLLIALPVMLVATIITALLTIILSPVLPNSQFSHYPARYWAKFICMLSFVKVKINGLEKLNPNHSYVIVLNHQSIFDVFVIYGWLPMIFKWMIKAEIRKIPFVGQACSSAGHIFIDRKNPLSAKRSLKTAKNQLRNGVSVVIFPEGTRTKTGAMGKFKKGAFMIATDLQLPVVPITLRGSYDRMKRNSFIITPGTIEMIIHSPVEVTPATGLHDLITHTHNIIQASLKKKQIYTMKKIIFFCIATLAFLPLNAQLFWKISGNGLSKPSYMFGTHHLIDKSEIPDFDKILDYVKKTDVVVGEVVMKNMLAEQMKMMKMATMTDTTLQDLMTPEQYLFADSAMKIATGMNLKPFNKMKPALISSLHTVMLYTKHFNIKKQPEAVDKIVQDKAKKRRKKIFGFETIDEQIDILFNSISLQGQTEMLLETLKDTEKSIDMIKKLNEYYLAGDHEKMLEISMEETETNTRFMKILLENRNRNWTEQLLKMLPENSCFIAVGSLHLPGETGLIQLLRNEGYEVTPVTEL